MPGGTGARLGPLPVSIIPKRYDRCVRLAPDLPRCRILGAANTVIDTWWCRKECDPFWRIYRNREEGAEILHAGGRLPLEAGCYYLVPAWTVFRGRCRGPLQHDFVHFQVLGLPGPWLRRHARTPLALASAPGWRGTFDRLGGDLPAAVQLRLSALLCEAVSQAVSGAEEPVTTGRAAELVAVAQRLAEAHPGRPPSVAELAAAAGVGPDHLARCFASVTGQTPARWLAERRVAAAAELLAAGNIPIEAIVSRLGFANRCHFSRVFRRLTGQPPAGYRRSLLLPNQAGRSDGARQDG